MATHGEPNAIRLGFPDFRTKPPREISFDDDLALAGELDRAASTSSFAALVERFYELQPAPRPELRRRHLRHFALEAEQAAFAIDQLAPAGPGALLDVGCGMGRYLLAGAGAGRQAVGVDVAAYQLVLARKLLGEHDLQARLLLAEAEALPFGDGEFAAVTATDVLEHVASPAATVAEIGRMLRPGGMAYFTTPNRFSLTAEPHVGQWGLGYLPRTWAEWWVKRRLGIDYGPIRPLSYGGLRALLRTAFPGDCEIVLPSPGSGELASFPPLKRLAARAYAVGRVAPGLRAAVARVAPYFVAVCRRR